jgi:methyltransferase (TIGR00027 family)
MPFTPPEWLRPSIAARTEFVDAEVMSALESGLRQVVICGAGYDDRALRFRTRGARFFELDHPSTQADKARLLRSITGLSPGTGEPADGVTVISNGLTLAVADFSTDDVGAVMRRAGHDGGQPSLYVCEGLLVYLDRVTCERLLAALAAHGPTGSRLVASLATHADGVDSAAVAAAANENRRTGTAEPWRTILPVDDHLMMLHDAGWTTTRTQWSPAASAEVSYGRRSLFVAADRLMAAPGH